MGRNDVEPTKYGKCFVTFKQLVTMQPGIHGIDKTNKQLLCNGIAKLLNSRTTIKLSIFNGQNESALSFLGESLILIGHAIQDFQPACMLVNCPHFKL